MENWQLILVILSAVLVGALIPVLIMIARVLSRAGKEISEVGERLVKLLTQMEVISDRAEVLSRGFIDGEKDIASLLKSAGNLSRGIEQNMKIVTALSTFLTSVGAVFAAFVKSKVASEKIPETKK